MTTETQASATDEQIAEWNAIHDEMRDLYTKKEQAESMAASYLGDHIKAGAMTPDTLGLPSVGAIDAYRRACECATEALEAWDQWQVLHEQAEAHPYTTVVRARQSA